MTTLERIQDDARKYAIVHSAAPDKDTPDWIVSDYMAGAKSERNKTIDEAIEQVSARYGERISKETLLELLKAMKV